MWFYKWGLFVIRAYAFDIDGTLTHSKSRLTHDVALRIQALLQTYPVALITGGNSQQIFDSIVEVLVTLPVNLFNLHIYPLSGAECYRYEKSPQGVAGWRCVQREEIPPHERQHISREIRWTAKSLGLWIENTWGDPIEDRLCQVTYSAWGQDAPLEIKRIWDTDGQKKLRLRDALAARLPEYSIRVGGLTSIDVNLSHVNKGKAVQTFAQVIGVQPNQVMFIGDQLKHGGNDYPVLATGACCIPVQSVEDTIRVIDSILGKP